MVKYWKTLKTQFCQLMGKVCECEEITAYRNKQRDCDSCDYYLYWVYLGRPKRPFQVLDEWEMKAWIETRDKEVKS